MKTLILGLSLAISSQLHASTPSYCVAHRSLGYGGLENSLEAFSNAIQGEADGIEFDLRHTKDRKTIIFHDKKLKRVSKGQNCDLKSPIHELTLAQISQNCLLQNGEVIPTFEEGLLLLSQSQTRLLIEFKDETITDSDLELIKNYYSDRPELVSVISFNRNILEVVEQKAKSDVFFQKIGTVRLKKWGFFGDLGNISALSTKYIHRSRVQKLQAKGIKVGAYTKDSAKRIQKYLNKGVDFITTNNSLLCKQIISKQ